MELSIDRNILNAFKLASTDVKLQQIGSGHINRTYLLTNLKDGERYILQNINTQVFKQPEVIAANISHVAHYLKVNFPDYLFPAPLNAANGSTMVLHKGDYWRLTPYIGQTVALDTLTSPKQAYEAAKLFGQLSRLLDNFDSTKLVPSIIGFHDLALRYQQFSDALAQANETLKEKSAKEIKAAIAHKNILGQYSHATQKGDFPNRVMHHDTKISNVLLDENNFEGVCVIDLDTMMPGKFISDLGDMMRTYLCEYSENEPDLSKISIRHEYFSAMIAGYLSEMGDILTKTEKELILFSGKYIIYMQALRFLTDYLNGNIYYPIQYPAQNLDRARNQFKLLSELIKDEETLQNIIDEHLIHKQVS